MSHPASYNLPKFVTYLLLAITTLFVTVSIVSFPTQFLPNFKPLFSNTSTIFNSLSKAVDCGGPNINSSDELSVHYVHIYPTSSPSIEDQLCFLECVALLSVFRHLKPDSVYFHTNAPNFSPFNSCHSIIPDTSSIKLVNLLPEFSIGRRKIEIIHHQADIAKLKVLRDCGGVVMDMDVFIINGEIIRDALKTHPCILSREGSEMLNAGFAACRKGSSWPRAVLKLYEKDYRADWYYNSAILPYKLLEADKQLQKDVFVDDTISDNPEGKEGYKMLDYKGIVNWRKKVAFQSFYHNCRLGIDYVNRMDTSFGELLRWILYDTEPNEVDR